jgi:hypothetical protein
MLLDSLQHGLILSDLLSLLLSSLHLVSVSISVSLFKILPEMSTIVDDALVDD